MATSSPSWRAAQATEAIRVAERIVAALAPPIDLGGRAVRCEASLGVADVGATAEALLRNADLAMYEAKAQGRNRIEIFHEGLHNQMERRVRLSEGLRHAIERDELSLRYQPIVDLADGAVLGAEALLRWSFEGQPVSPLEFIAIAGATGQIGGIGKWVLNQACETAVSC